MKYLSKTRKPTIWIGQYKFGAKTIYAVTAASDRAQCAALIKGGPFLNTVPRCWTLTPYRQKKPAAKTRSRAQRRTQTN